MQSSLYFVNIDAFKKKLKIMIDSSYRTNSTKLSNESIKMNAKTNGGLLGIESETSSDNFFGKYILLDFSAVNYIDSTGFKVLLEV